MLDFYKDFYCEQCSVRFRITIEPLFDPATVEREYPESVSWLGKARMCPVCEDDLKED